MSSFPDEYKIVSATGIVKIQTSATTYVTYQADTLLASLLTDGRYDVLSQLLAVGTLPPMVISKYTVEPEDQELFETIYSELDRHGIDLLLTADQPAWLYRLCTPVHIADRFGYLMTIPLRKDDGNFELNDPRFLAFMETVTADYLYNYCQRLTTVNKSLLNLLPLFRYYNIKNELTRTLDSINMMMCQREYICENYPVAWEDREPGEGYEDIYSTELCDYGANSITELFSDDNQCIGNKRDDSCVKYYWDSKEAKNYYFHDSDSRYQ